jgi:hypothetical protein
MLEDTPALPMSATPHAGSAASTAAQFQNPGSGGAPRGNANALTHGAYSSRIIGSRAQGIAEEVLAAHPHLDAAKDGPALLRYGGLLARLARADEWLKAQPDDLFCDPELGVVHAVLARVDRWERAAADAEHRLALDPYTRSKLGLVQAQAFDLAAAMAEAHGNG